MSERCLFVGCTARVRPGSLAQHARAVHGWVSVADSNAVTAELKQKHREELAAHKSELSHVRTLLHKLGTDGAAAAPSVSTVRTFQKLKTLVKKPLEAGAFLRATGMQQEANLIKWASGTKSPALRSLYEALGTAHESHEEFMECIARHLNAVAGEAASAASSRSTVTAAWVLAKDELRLGPWKCAPDLALLPHDKPLATAQAVCVAEGRTGHGDVLVDELTAHVVQYGEAMLEAQFLRKTVEVILFNQACVSVFSFHRGPHAVRETCVQTVHHTAQLSWSSALPIVLSLMLRDVGAPLLPVLDGVYCMELLGQGISARVFSLSDGNSVLKLANDTTCNDDMDVERDVTQALAGTPGILTVVSSSSGTHPASPSAGAGRAKQTVRRKRSGAGSSATVIPEALRGLSYVVLAPRCTDFSARLPLRRCHAVQVLDALAAAHAQGWVHRDVRPPNIMVRDDHAYLIDWGYAVKLPASGEVCGTIRCAAPSVLAAWELGVDHKWSHWDDIFSWMYTCFLLAYPDLLHEFEDLLRSEDSSVKHKHAGEIEAFWHGVFGSGLAGWAQLRSYVQEASKRRDAVNYGRLRELVDIVLPLSAHELATAMAADMATHKHVIPTLPAAASAAPKPLGGVGVKKRVAAGGMEDGDERGAKKLGRK